ncbi:hypothetical protein [Nonomuraea sp. KM90]
MLTMYMRPPLPGKAFTMPASAPVLFTQPFLWAYVTSAVSLHGRTS